MHRYFVNYIAAGDPNGEGLPEWKPVAEPGMVFELGAEIGPVPEPYVPLHAVLDRMQKEAE